MRLEVPEVGRPHHNYNECKGATPLERNLVTYYDLLKR